MNEEEKKITGEIDISKTIESNIDYWRNKCFEQQKEIEELKEKNKILEELLQGRLFELYNYYKELAGKYQGNCISKDKIKELIEKYKTEKNNITQIVFSKYEKTQQAYKQVVYTNLIRVLEGLLSGQESDQEGGQENE